MRYQPKIPGNLHLVAPVGQTPKYVHDCDGCHFLGQQTKADGNIVDLYVHCYEHRPTVIARLSDQNSDYQAGYEVSYGQSDLLTEARHRAETLGLVQYDVYTALTYAKRNSPDAERLHQEVLATPEYLAYQAHLQGDESTRASAMNQFVDARLAVQLQYKPTALRSDALMAVESDMVRVIVAGARISEFDAMKVTLQMTEPEWLKVTDEVDAPLDDCNTNTAAV